MLVERQLAVVDGFAAAMIGQHALRPRRHPLHRSVDAARGPEHQRVIGKRIALETEAAADIGRHHPDLVLRQVKDMRHLHAHAVRVLRCGVERVIVVGGVVVADCDARLHAHRLDAVVLDSQLDDVPRVGEDGVGCVLAAEHQPEPDIALRAIVPDLDGAILGRIFELDHRRERFVVDLHQLGRIACLGERLGDDERDPVADEAHLLGIEHGLEGAMPLGGAEVLRHQMRGEAAELFCCGVGAGEHTKHAGSRLGLGYVDADDAGMRVRGEHDGAMAKAGQADVIDIASLSEQETLVFHSPHSLSDAELGHFPCPLFKM